MAAEIPIVQTPQGSTQTPGVVSASPQVPSAYSTQQAQHVGQPSSSKPNFSLGKNTIYIIVGILAVLLLGFAVWFFFLRARAGSTEITWWGLWEDESTFAPLISEYESKNPKVKVTYVAQAKEDYRERLANAFAQGKGPDIFRFHNSWVPMFRNDLDTLPSSVMSASEFSQTFYPVYSSDLANGASIVGIPLEYDGLVLYINQDIFDSNGKTPPATWDDLRATARELTTKDDKGVITQAGVALGRTENVDHWPEILALMMLQNGVDLSNPTGKLAEDAIKFYTIFSSVDGVWDKSLPPSTIDFADGKLAMMFGPSWRAFDIYAKNPSLKFKMVPVPQLPKANPTEPSIAYASYWAEGVWAKSKSKAAAWDFLKFLSTQDSLEKTYSNSVKLRAFGEPYPRVDMSNLLSTDPLVGGVISQAPYAESWYLQSRTFDGTTGINSQIDKYFEDAVNSVNSGGDAKRSLETVAKGVNQVLAQYGLAKPLATP